MNQTLFLLAVHQGGYSSSLNYENDPVPAAAVCDLQYFITVWSAK